MTQLDDRSAVYASPGHGAETPDPQRVPLDLTCDERARLGHLEGMVTALLGRVDELERRLDEREGDGK